MREKETFLVRMVGQTSARMKVTEKSVKRRMK